MIAAPSREQLAAILRETIDPAHEPEVVPPLPAPLPRPLEPVARGSAPALPTIRHNGIASWFVVVNAGGFMYAPLAAHLWIMRLSRGRRFPRGTAPP